MQEILLIFKTLLPYFVTFIFLILLLEQVSYLRKKRSAPGPTFVLPFLGNALWMIRDTFPFWVHQSSMAESAGISANYLIGNFVIFIRDASLSHVVFSNVKPDGFTFIGHPFGKKLFGDHNLIYLSGQEHKDKRARIAPNFIPKALATYISLQQMIILDHFKRWVDLASRTNSEPITLRFLVRDMNLETSQTVFVGPYLDTEAREKFNKDYYMFNNGVKYLPIDLPGTAFRRAKLALGRLSQALEVCAKQSKYNIQQGSEPKCLIDFYMQETNDDNDVSFLFDFLYAAQDASTSSLLWAVALLDLHQEVLAKVREEVTGIWNPESNELITPEQLCRMKYTHAVAREILRYRPPATVIPHLAAVDFPLTEWYTIPKGTIVFPSPYEACFQGFTEADRFDPDRFSEERQEDQVYKRNYLVFGAGAHQCPGQRYAVNHLVIFIAMFTTLIDFKRHRTDDCDDIVFNPVIFPKDDSKVFLSKRCSSFPTLSLH